MSGTQVTVRDVAQKASVSVATVSRAFNDAVVLRPSTREKVLRAAQELGYVAPPNGSKKTPLVVIGLLFVDVPSLEADSIYQTAVTNALYTMAAREDVCIMPEPLQFESDGGLRKPKIVATGHVSGLICIGHLSSAHLEQVVGWGLPVCSLESQKRLSDSHYSVGFDCKVGIREAVQYLVALGHRKCAFVYGSEEYPSNKDKKEGFIETLREFHVEVDESYLYNVESDSQNYAGGFEATQALLARENRPTAIVYANDWFAVGGIHAAAAAGVDIPKDLSIIGFDNSFMANQCKPGLTSVSLDVHKMATVTIDTFIRKLMGRTVLDCEHLIKTELVVRETCGPVL